MVLKRSAFCPVGDCGCRVETRDRYGLVPIAGHSVWSLGNVRSQAWIDDRLDDPLSTHALLSAITQFAAWLGLVPRQHSTGGKDQLLGISKRGDTDLRTRLVHGAHAALLQPSGNPKSDRQSPWIVELPSRKPGHVTAVANRMARIAWAILTTNQPCRTEEAMA